MIAFGLLIFCLTSKSIGRTFLVETKEGTHSKHSGGADYQPKGGPVNGLVTPEQGKAHHRRHRHHSSGGDYNGIVKSEFGGDYSGPSEEKGKGGRSETSDVPLEEISLEPSETTGGPSETTGGPSETSGGSSETSGGPSKTTGGPSKTSNGSSEITELKARIDKYLADNKKQKTIDREKLILSLRSKYPEYEQREKEVFKKQVDKTFKEMAAEVAEKKNKKEGGSGKGKGKKKG